LDSSNDEDGTAPKEVASASLLAFVSLSVDDARLAVDEKHLKFLKVLRRRHDAAAPFPLRRTTSISNESMETMLSVAMTTTTTTTTRRNNIIINDGEDRVIDE
jgi:hypothetical protein